VLTVKGREGVGTARVGSSYPRIEPQAEMIHLHWFSWWVGVGVGREDHRRRRRPRSNGECLNAEHTYEIADANAVAIGTDVALIPR
jgi:hypothetical protein